MEEWPRGSWRGTQLKALQNRTIHKACFWCHSTAIAREAIANSGQQWQGQASMLAEAEGTSSLIVHRAIWKCSWIFFLVQWHSVAFYPTLRTDMAVIIFLTVGSGFLYWRALCCFWWLVATCPRRNFRQCGLWLILWVLCSALLLRFLSTYYLPFHAKWRGTSPKNFGKT